MRTDMVVSYVRDLVEQVTGVRPEPDQDGDLPVRHLGADFYIRVVGDDPVVQVFAVALADLASTPELHTALNDINRQLRFARTFHVADQVLIEHEIWGTDVNPQNLEYACRTVASAADHFGHQLSASFGGQLRFEESKSDSYTGNDTAPTYGMYL
jgi:hypothetical protein